jgi:hypothetical protein
LKALAQVFTVPASSVIEEQGAAYIMVVNKKNRVSKRAVKLGMRVKQQRVVLQGIELGERVVSRDIASLSDGQQVKIRDAKVATENTQSNK